MSSIRTGFVVGQNRTETESVAVLVSVVHGRTVRGHNVSLGSRTRIVKSQSPRFWPVRCLFPCRRSRTQPRGHPPTQESQDKAKDVPYFQRLHLQYPIPNQVRQYGRNKHTQPKFPTTKERKTNLRRCPQRIQQKQGPPNRSKEAQHSMCENQLPFRHPIL